MSPMPGLTEKIAASVVVSLLKASAGMVRKRLGQPEAKKALETAVAGALAEALEGQALGDEAREHYGSLLAEFFGREEAAFELAQLLDPRPDQVPDFATLSYEFRMAGYDPETMPGFDLDSFLQAFFSAFYGAVGSEESLRTGIDHKLLGAQLQQLGIAVAKLDRVAEAGERSADTLGRIEANLERYLAGRSEVEELRRMVEAARAEGFLAAYRTFEDIGSGLLKAGLDLGMDSQGTLEIVSRSSDASRALPAARLESVRLLAGDLLRTVDSHSPSEDELNALEERYREHIIRWFESLTFQGMMRAPKPIVLPLEEVYVELRAVAEVPEAADAFSVEERRLLLEIEEKDDTKRRELMSQLDAFRRERWSRTIPERKSMAEALHQRDHRAFVILGDPGSGKTTLLHFLALVYARGPETAARRLGVDPSEADRLPIFVPLAAFDDMLRESQREGQSLTLLEFLPRYYARRRNLPSLEPLFRRAFESGRALVLLDGLDEVLDVGTRTYVAQQAGAFIGEWSSRGVRFAVSSRFVGYREAPMPGNLPTLSVLDFGTPEIEIFVRRWAHAFEKWVANGIESPEMLRRAQALEADLLEDVRSNESVRRLAANPLMLTMLALLRRQVGRLPHRRVQLYESYVGTLLENWVDARSEGARERSVAILDRHQAESILIPLAFWLQKEKPSGTAGRAEIKNKLVEICLKERGIDPAQAERPAYRDAEKEADRFLQEMRQMAGLIIERGHDTFGFLHLTFQEYFAGRALAQLSDDERWKAIRPNLHDPRWREPILLCAGRLGVVENRRAQVTQLVRSILDNDDPTEADLHRNLLCALSIACDDVNLEPGLVTDLVERAIAQLTDPVRAFVGDLLGFLGQLVANGMVAFGVCRAAVEQSTNAGLIIVVIHEWGRFVGVTEIGVWLRSLLDNDNEWIVWKALDTLALQLGEDQSLWRKVIDCLGSNLTGDSAGRALSRPAQRNLEIRRVLLENLAHKNEYVRHSSLIALSDLVSSDLEVRSAFLEKLTDSASIVRSQAAHGLSAFVGEDIEVRRNVLALLHDDDKAVRLSAVKALSRSLSTDQEALLRVLDLLVHGEDTANILEGLMAGLPAVPEIHKVFLEKLEALDWRARQVACRGLAEGNSASFADLMRVFRSRVTLESLAIFNACASFAGCRSEEKWIAFWLGMLSHSEPGVRRSAVSVLRGVAKRDEEVRQALERLGYEEWELEDLDLSLLPEAELTDEEVGRQLERLGGGDSRARYLALSALGGVAGKREKVLRAVLELLGDVDPFVQQAAISALAGSVGVDEKVRCVVLERLGDPDPGIRKSSVSALAGAIDSAEDIRHAVLERLEDENFGVRLQVVEVLSRSEDEVFFEDLRSRLWAWLGVDGSRFLYFRDSHELRSVQAQLAKRFGARLPDDFSLREKLLSMLGDPRWSARLGAVLALLAWPGGPPDEVMERVLTTLEDSRGLEAYPAQLTAASYLINQNDTAAEAIHLCLEALDYGTQPWENILGSRKVRKQAALVLGKLEPVFFHERVYDKLLHVLRNDEDPVVRDAAYGTLVRLAGIREQRAVA